MAHLLIENLTKKYKGKTAINNLSVAIEDGEFFVLLGPTGAGKTTTLRCIAGLEKPGSGSIYIDHNQVDDWGIGERDVAMVFQHFSLYPDHTVKWNLEFPLKSKFRNYSAEEIERKISKVMEVVRIAHLADRKTDKLSGGEMQRVSIGRAIVRNPKVFLMDEPLSNLDAKLREVLRVELKTLQMDLGATFIFVTHDQVEAMTMGDRIGVINEGNLIQIGTPYEIYNHPDNAFVAQAVGSPEINFFDSIIRHKRMIVIKNIFELELHTDIVKRLNSDEQEVRVGIRPEDIKLSAENGIKARVYGIENMGMEKIVTLNVDDHFFKATLDPEVELEIDSTVNLEFDQERFYFFHHDTGESLLK